MPANKPTDTQQLTQIEFTQADHKIAQEIGRRLGYTQMAYTSTSALWGYFCMAENPEHSKGPTEPLVIIKTKELGFLIVKDLEDCRFYDLQKKDLAQTRIAVRKREQYLAKYTKRKIVFEYDQDPDFSWLEQDQYDPSKPGYDPIYPTGKDMKAKRNAYDGNWYRNPDNHIALEMIVYEQTPDDQDWRIVDTLGGIDFLVTGNDWTTGTFYRLKELNGCPYLRTLAKEHGLR